MQNILVAATAFGFRHTKWAICECCNGNGSVENPAFSNGFTSEEWDDMKSDYDERDESTAAERYMRGDYDVACVECDGSGKVRVANVENMSFGEKRGYVRYMREQGEIARAERQIDAENAAERRMSA